MRERMWSPRRQGDAGEVSAIEWFKSLGAAVFIPVGHSPDYDLVADFGEQALRIQVKTSTRFRAGRYEVALATRGGNRSWNGIVKRLDASRCDYVFIHVADGRRWLIPAGPLDGSSLLPVGGPEYASFEVEPGHELAARPG